MRGNSMMGDEVGLTYTTEVQTDFRKASKWVNLLRLDLSCRLDKKIRFCFSSISIAETRQDALVDDMQGFSNIEEKNLPFAPAVLGLEYRTSRSSLFLGVRKDVLCMVSHQLGSVFTSGEKRFPAVAVMPVRTYSSIGKRIPHS
ncbi:hypothetical protein [Phocaeicola barnesiae]|uniref:hypothetical protein n=1 Tax=Phocaeicola barnesiae TaxID=376804 RepID=UPI0025A3AB17|nr:hypothetical protein [Phocaeicola barnesiae]MDM8256904.1 hypothetical protein [Phocaeicola barnesiae]